MKLSTCLEYINAAVNFPALSYNDVGLFFDMAIAELNTTLHTSIPTMSKQFETFRQISSNKYTLVRLTEDPIEFPEIPVIFKEDYPNFPNVDLIQNVKFCIFDDDKKYYTYSLKEHAYVKSEYPLRGVYSDNGVLKTFISLIVGSFTDESSPAQWILDNSDDVTQLDMEDYLPDEWILLWVIPYVCFKYTVRDGGPAQTFAEEIQQGFQQLQETYNVPEKVILATVADKVAYLNIVKEKLPNLNVLYPTQAIYESMKHSRGTVIMPNSIFNRGGFGV